MTEEDEIAEDEANERAYVKAEFNRKTPTAKPGPGQVARYFKIMDLRGGACDNVWIDRLLDKEVLRYDAADPANTSPHYGATPDGTTLAGKGCDLTEVIPLADSKVSPADLWQWSVDDHACRDDDPPEYEPEDLDSESWRDDWTPGRED